MNFSIEHMPILISALAFWTLLSLIMLLLYLAHRYGSQRDSIRKLKNSDNGMAMTGDDGSATASKNLFLKIVLDLLGYLGQHLGADKSADLPQLRTKFLQAGLRKAAVPHIYWGAKCLLALCLPLGYVFGRLGILIDANMPFTIAACFLSGLFGFYLPDYWLHLKIQKRKKRLMEALPDTLDLLVICVEAGLGLDAAIKRVADELKLRSRELSEELSLLNLEMRHGMLRRDALRNLARRTDLEALNSLVTLLIQTERFGTSITQALRVYSDAFRTERFRKAEEMATKLPIKLLFPLIFFIFPSLFVVILGPAIIRIHQVLMH